MELFYRVRFDDAETPLLQYCGFELANIPEITYPTRNRNKFTVPNRDGELLGSDMWRSNAYIKCTFHTRIIQGFNDGTIGEAVNYLLTNTLPVVKTLHIDTKKTGYEIPPNESSENASNATDTTPDIMEGWNRDGYYEVLGYTVVSDTRKANDYAKLEIQFEVFPYKFEYLDPPYTDEMSFTNVDYDTSMPMFVYSFESGVTSATLSVNNKSMTIYKPAGSSIVFIDTRRQIAYYQDNENLELYHEVRVAGDYRNLYFKRGGDITIAVSSGTVRTYPRWGWKL